MKVDFFTGNPSEATKEKLMKVAELLHEIKIENNLGYMSFSIFEGGEVSTISRKKGKDYAGDLSDIGVFGKVGD